MHSIGGPCDICCSTDPHVYCCGFTAATRGEVRILSAEAEYFQTLPPPKSLSFRHRQGVCRGASSIRPIASRRTLPGEGEGGGRFRDEIERSNSNKKDNARSFSPSPCLKTFQMKPEQSSRGVCLQATNFPRAMLTSSIHFFATTRQTPRMSNGQESEQQLQHVTEGRCMSACKEVRTSSLTM